MEFVTVFRAFNPTEADVVFSRLDAAGFHPMIVNGQSAMSTLGHSLAVGGILVQVPDEESKEAGDFLASPTETPGEPPLA